MATITSYAQNFEDVMLWRALKQVDNGFYIDVGAQDPIVDSVSLLFHEHGWEGIHVEPTPYYAELLRQSRPNDVVIQAAIGNERNQLLPFFEIAHSGISTAASGIAAQHQARGEKVRAITVPCIPLAAVFQVAKERDIHWLKIDVEGFEHEVLAGWGSPKSRPWIVVVESTLPLTRIASHQRWEPMLLGYGYVPAYFDGLNKYYVSAEHTELQHAFALPPNIFDDFAVNGTANSPFHQRIVTRHQEELEAIQESVRAAETEAAVKAAESGKRIEELESTLRQQRHQLECCAEQSSAVDAGYRRELQIARSEVEACRSAALNAVNAHNDRIRNLEAAMARQRQELTGRLDEVTGQLQAQQAVCQALDCTLRERKELAREQLELLQASERRQQDMLAQMALLQAGQVESGRREQALQAKLLEQRSGAQRQIETLAEQHRDSMRSMAAEHQETREILERQVRHQREQIRAAVGAKNEYELLNRHQSDLIREATNRERELREEVSLLVRQLAAREARECNLNEQLSLLISKNESERTEADSQHKAEQLAAAKAHASARRDLECKLDSSRRQLEEIVRDHESELTQLTTELARARQDRVVAKNTIAVLEGELSALRGSLTWSLLAPLRLVERRLQSLRARRAIRASKPHLGSNGHLPQDCGITQSGESEAMVVIFNKETPIQAVSDINALISLPHEDFVECAYRSILLREPDSTGLAHYTDRILAGESKFAILRDLYESEEARASGIDLPWLREAIARYERRNRTSSRVLRRLISFGNVRAELIERIRLAEERQSYLERKYSQMHKHLSDRVQSLEACVSNLQRQQTSEAVQIDPASREPDLSENVKNNEARSLVSSLEYACLGRSRVTKRILRDMAAALSESNMASNDPFRP